MRVTVSFKVLDDFFLRFFGWFSLRYHGFCLLLSSQLKLSFISFDYHMLTTVSTVLYEKNDIFQSGRLNAVRTTFFLNSLRATLSQHCKNNLSGLQRRLTILFQQRSCAQSISQPSLVAKSLPQSDVV